MSTVTASTSQAALDLVRSILEKPATTERRMADALRVLAIDAVERAKSGHPGMPMGMADVATVLFTRFLKYDSADPAWPDRDRFVLSAGHGSMLLYGLLHLTGVPGMETDQLMKFRQLGSHTAGHPEHEAHPAIETTTGPLGQGFATAVGMALAERMLAGRFGKSLVDHRTWVIASDGDLMEGISHEAASLAGHLKLDRLIVLFDDNGISIDGSVSLACSDDVLKRFQSYGWATQAIDGHDHAMVAQACARAMRSKKPTLIACRTVIGFAAPTKGGTAATHGAPLGQNEAEATRAALGWEHPPFEIPAELRARWEEAGRRGAAARLAWKRRLALSSRREEFERAIQGRFGEGWSEALAACKASFQAEKPKLATRQASQKVLEAVAPVFPELVGGSADLTGSNLTLVKAMVPVGPGNFTGRYLHFGIREHAMAAAMNGIALHRGFIPYGGTFLVFSDYMRPSIRLAALMRQRVIHVLTHDSIGLGEDGPTHQPVEHLAALRAIPNLNVFRPADPVETAECWALALAQEDVPSLLALSRQSVPTLRLNSQADNPCARGAYVLAEADGERRATLLATGTEVAIAMAARELLRSAGVSVAVVSMPCWRLFEAQGSDYQADVLGTAPRFGIEAALSFGWDRWLGDQGVFIGMRGFGASAPAEDLYRHFGITAEKIAEAVLKRVG